MSAGRAWSTPGDIEARVRRHWNSGALLRDSAVGADFTPIEVVLHGPSASEIEERVEDARRWKDALVRGAGAGAGRRYDLSTTARGGRHVVPVRAIVASWDQAWSILEAREDVARFRELINLSPEIPRQWAIANPLRALAVANEWAQILAAYEWIGSHRGRGLYLREITAPGVDTKLIERHVTVLAAFLGVKASRIEFELGFAVKPSFVRMRFEPRPLGMPNGLTEGSFRTNELGQLAVQVREALIVENEITYLSVPVPDAGVVLWGKGYDANNPASLAWLHGIPVRYWGDIDTHGFAILNRVRGSLPHVTSILMDEDTLWAHEERWGNEDTPSTAALPQLTPAEARLYESLVTDRFGRSVRLEQERIDWEWACRQLQASGD